jgi:hypothetical protein
MSEKHADKRVVWILGSGFSRSLGGPLLRDLLSHAKRSELGARQVLAGSVSPDEPMGNVYRCFHELKSGGYCEDAEGFLEYVESIEEDAARKKIVEAWLPGGDSANFLRLCRKVIAAECDFVRVDVNLDAERWAPYKRWANEQASANRIITFNYDRVLEQLNMKIAVPWTQEEGQVYKLHGSIDWGLEPGGFFQANLWQSTDPHTEVEPFIATPGRPKKDRSMKLKALWLKAKEALTAANVIVFMGYRFPASDAHARSELLGAIKANEQPHLRIHTVLGPRTHDDDTVRLLKLLEHSLRSGDRTTQPELELLLAEENLYEIPGAKTFAIVPQPLYVEDFLSVIHDEELYGY